MLQRLHRDRLNLNVPVCLPFGGNILGRVSDISLGGFCLSGSGLQPPNDVDELLLLLPWEMKGIRRIELAVEQRWVAPSRGGRWHVGYRIVGCPSVDLVALNHLSSSFSSRYHQHA